jgi:hypothetical protein
MERSTVSPPKPESKTAILGRPLRPTTTCATSAVASAVREFSNAPLTAVSQFGFEGARLCGVPGKPAFGLLGCLELRRLLSADPSALAVEWPPLTPIRNELPDSLSSHFPYQLIHQSYIIDALQVGVSSQRLALLSLHQKPHLG